MKEKRGRPRKENAKNKRFNLRLSEDEYANLIFMSEETGKSMSDVIKEGLRIYGNLVKYQD